MKTNPRSPLKEINGSSIPPPPIGLSESARAGGCFGFLLNSSCKIPSKTLSRTPQSAPPDPIMVSSKCSTKALRYQTLQKAPSISDLELAKLCGANKRSKPTAPGLLKKWSRSNPTASTSKEPEEKLDCEDSLRGNIGSCSASTPRKSFSLQLINNGSFKVSKEEDKKATGTPTLIAAPPIEASISPEVPIGAFEVADTPVCFGTGHLMAGVRDRRKCRPRGILKIGESEEHHVEMLQDGKIDAAEPSLTPPIVEASVHWLSPPSGDLGSEVGSGLQTSFRVLSPAKVSVNWLISHTQDEDEALNRFFSTQDCLSEAETSVDQSVRKSSSFNYSLKGSPGLFGLLSLKKLGFESTPSSGICVQKTPSTGGSISPFSMILERVARASNCKLAKSQQSLLGQQNGFTPEKLILSGDSLTNHLVSPMQTSDFCSKKRANTSAIKREKLKDVLGSMKHVSNDLNVQESLPAQDFQFEFPPLSLDSVDLNYFQKTSHDVVPSSKSADKKLQKCGTRVSWREGLVSRIFEMGELEYHNWLSDDEGSLNDMEDDKLIRDVKFNHSRSSSFGYEKDQLTSAASNSVELASASVHAKIDALVSPTAPISKTEATSIDGLDVISSGDSDWIHFYRNQLFEV